MRQTLQLFGVLQDKVAPLNEVDLSISFDKIIADSENVVDYNKSCLLAINTTTEIKKDFVVVVKILRLLQLDSSV